MCGRYSLTSSPKEVFSHFDLADLDGFPPRYNIAPTQPMLIVKPAPRREGANRTERMASLVRWGLVPSWAKDPKDLPLLINARSETASEKASFRGPMRHGRILIPASGFYEWRRSDGRRGQPFWVRPRQGDLFAFAGLFSAFMAADGSEIETAAILTTRANATLAPIHERMPVVIGPGDYDRWMNGLDYEPRHVTDLLDPASDDFFEPVPVSEAVNKVSNDGPELQRPVERDAPTADDGPRQHSLF